MIAAIALFQSTERRWPAAAIHDSVQAVLRDPAFRRSVSRSLADRLLIWLVDGFGRMGRLLKHLPSTRSLALALIALLLLFVLARIVLSARERGGRATREAVGRAAASSVDLWAAADAFMQQGRYEEAAHALYRGVLLALGRKERVRLDPARTSGDYARELRRRGASSLGPFSAFTRRFDVVVYGNGGADSASLAELRALSAPFRLRVHAA